VWIFTILLVGFYYFSLRCYYISMDSYSHGAFQVSGYKASITSKAKMMEEIRSAWGVFMGGDMQGAITHKAYPHLHCVYYNFVDPTGPNLGYDMLIGFATEDGSVQADPRFTTITIPAQNYKYTKVVGDPRETLPKVWADINAMPKEDVVRTYGYDMEMYGAGGDEVTVAVSVV
jgi:predicted transcriptional regulator YdeE